MVARKSEDSGSFIERAAKLVTSIRTDASLTSLLNKAYEGRLRRSGGRPPDYSWVGDLVNPVSGYWARKHPVKDPPELAQRFAYGKAIHREARYWFQNLPGFLLFEGKLDGGYVGIDGVVGSLDFLLGKSVLEFKTKYRAPRTPQDLTTTYPQDLEQLLFYAALLPDLGDDHYLVFLDGRDSKLKAFRVQVKNRGIVIALMRERMSELRRALRENDPSRFGRCRYFDADCKYRQAGICSCENLLPLDVSGLLKGTSIERDSEFEVVLEEAKRKAGAPPDEVFWWDLLSPRRRLLRREGREPPYTTDQIKKASKEILYSCIGTVTQLQPETAAVSKAREAASQYELVCPLNFISARSSKRGGGTELRPYLVQAPKGEVREPRKLFPFYIAELAIRCAIAGCPRGVVFAAYPYENNRIVAYAVSFSGVRELRALVDESLERIREADRVGDPNLLEKCEPFMRDGCSDACLCRGVGAE